MWKKRMLCLALAICALLMTGCQQKEVFDTIPPSSSQANSAGSQTENQAIFTETDNEEIDFDNGSYDPASEDHQDDWEAVEETAAPIQAAQETAAPIMQSEYAGATPLLIDPIDKPTPTPLPTLSFTYETYTASALHMTFDAPSGWTVDESQADSYKLTYPNPAMDYAASLTVRAIPVNKAYSKNELAKEVKGMLDTLSASGDYSKFEPSNTAERTFLNNTGVYANYKAVTKDGALIAGRIIVTCVNKTLYTLHVTYPRGYTEFYVENVYDKFRHTVKLT